jgi:hypothetical protein
MSTGNIRGQRTQSSTNGYKTLGSSIASGNNGGAFKRIYINAYQRYNGNSDLALSSTLGIQKGDYGNTQLLNTIYNQQPTLPKNPQPCSGTKTCTSGSTTWTCPCNKYCGESVNYCYNPKPKK